MIKVIVIGAGGRMGRMLVTGIANDKDLELVGAVEAPSVPFIGKDAGELAGIAKIGVEITGDSHLSELFKKADVAINFITPKEAVIKHLQVAVENKKPMVIGTTGFNADEMIKIKELAGNIPCVMAPNMSIGINVMLKVIRDMAKVLGDDYDVEVIEIHHHFKKDSPSGTADRIARVLAESLNRDLDEVGIYGRKGIIGERTVEEIGIHAVRAGDIVGDHIVLFGGIGERIEIIHRAQSRDPYVKGALRAAKWVVNASNGLHDISEVLGLQ
ncbi:TPA: 4-hydroxy-tetrahydrodipicolinate reductase [Candidatus Poribacteria bacterium]|nr:4-hydroxy-tetrahydrodipicolinate reductase [Candidatus Poribacteria bacterium]